MDPPPKHSARPTANHRTSLLPTLATHLAHRAPLFRPPRMSAMVMSGRFIHFHRASRFSRSSRACSFAALATARRLAAEASASLRLRRSWRQPAGQIRYRSHAGLSQPQRSRACDMRTNATCHTANFSSNAMLRI